MKRDDEQYTVSTSHVGLRTVAFVLAVVLAVSAFGFGISRIGRKNPGYYEIEAPASEEASFYRNGFTLLYYFEGSSDAIKAEMNTLKDLYSTTLMRSYKLLDSINTYDGYVNLATLNQSAGEPVQVSDELFAILEDAERRTREGKVFSLFAGAMYAEWNSILSLDDISEFDPANHEEMGARITALARKTGDLSHFTLSMDPANHTVSFGVSEEYRHFLEENEYDSHILSTNVLTDAYRLEMIRNALEQRGFCNGYLYTDSGLTLSLSGHGEGSYAVYARENGQIVQCAAVDAGANSANSFLRVFPMLEEETMYHRSADGSGYYHPNFGADGFFGNATDSVSATRFDGDIVNCCYESLILLNSDSFEAAGSFAGDTDTLFVCTFLQNPNQVFSNQAQKVQGSGAWKVESF